MAHLKSLFDMVPSVFILPCYRPENLWAQVVSPKERHLYIIAQVICTLANFDASKGYTQTQRIS